MNQKGRVGGVAAAAVLPEEIVNILLPEETTTMRHVLGSKTDDDDGSPALAPPNGDAGEDRIITDFGPGGRMLGSNLKKSTTMPSKVHDTSECFADTERTTHSSSSSWSCFDPLAVLDREVTDEQGLRRRVVYDPTEIARVLHLRPTKQRNRHRSEQRGGSSSSSSGTKMSAAAANSDALLSRLAGLLETALDPSRPGRESLLICKAVTDAYLVNARRLARPASAATITAEGGGISTYREVNFIADALRESWQHAVEHWNGDSDEPHSAADLHVTASWFQAWSAADDMRGGGEPTMGMYKLHRILPGNWAWVLDHLEIAGAPEG